MIKKHYGTLEVGTALENIVKELQEVMNIEILLILKNSKLKVSLLNSLKKYDENNSMLFGAEFFSNFHPKLKDGVQLTYKEHNYIIYKGVDLFSFNGIM